MLSGPELAYEQLLEIEEASEGTVEIVEATEGPAGHLRIQIAVGFDGLDWADGGLPVRARELFNLLVPPVFPFDYPFVVMPHRRFAGFPHVQWTCHPCLYSSAAEWRPEEGMYGFIRRLDGWIRDAALNNLDPDDAPLHPPVAYHTVERLVVPRANTPRIEQSVWIGFAKLRERHHRTEIVGWQETVSGAPAGRFAPVVLLHEPFPFEYPSTVKALLRELEAHGIDESALLIRLAVHAEQMQAGAPLVVVLGTPMRRVDAGRALQHLAAWEISGEDADRLRKIWMANERDARKTAIVAVLKWADEANVGWCRVSETRPEVTRRRDRRSPMEWFRGKRVAIWGCGAIGTRVAESIVRAGVGHVELVDNGRVGPGLLVRQAFEDSDIGRLKATALGERLKRIVPGVEVSVGTADLVQRLGGPEPIPDVDLVIDCTASSVVRMKLEQTLRDLDRRPPITCMGVGHDAAAGIATLATAEHSGGPLDLIRRLKLEACRKPRLFTLRQEFWPAEPRGEHFQPEPGCSEPTFVGSDADLAGLSARMLNAVARALRTPDAEHTGFGWIFEEQGPLHTFAWTPDQVLAEKGRGYSVRVSPEALREMRAWARRSARAAGSAVETGGLVFGELNQAAGVLWVTEVEGPPLDSEAADDHFTCGTAGMKEAAEEKKERYRGSVSCVGSWHTHPTSSAHPSSVDFDAVAQLLAAPQSTRRDVVLLILSGSPDDPVLGAHAFRTKLRGRRSSQIEETAAPTIQVGREIPRKRDVGLALSGGGARAIAFHLGCFRALNDLGLLDRLQVISSVSGGSVIAALYAYSNESFQEFEARVVALLRRGLSGSILRRVLRPTSLAKSIRALLTAGGALALRLSLRVVRRFRRPGRPRAAEPPPIRGFSRSEAFRDVLASLFRDALMRDIKRESLDVVVNATELRTGSAFRFGSRQSGCWRFGEIAPEDARLADAVAASAAYPALLPALDRHYRFIKKGATSGPTRVLLTDGGVFENLGAGPMEPGRDPRISTNVYDPAYLISCDAGAGLFDGDCYPMWWPSRMHQSFLTVFRKVQDATRGRLHRLDESGAISGFVLSYLGQNDDSLPWIPSGLPSRQEVRGYPTDFSPMDTEDIDRLALRGELLTRLLIGYYLPDL